MEDKSHFCARSQSSKLPPTRPMLWEPPSLHRPNPLLLLLVVRAGNGGPRRKRDPSARHPLFSPVGSSSSNRQQQQRMKKVEVDHAKVLKIKGLSRLLPSIERTGGGEESLVMH